jgi:hypothetical protein
LRQKVDIRIRIQPLADTSDFRVQLGAEEEQRIKEQYSKDLGAKLAGALGELVSDLKKCVLDSKQRFESYATGKDGKVIHTFRDTAITNLREMIGDARKLNVLGDRTLNGLFDEIEQSLCSKDPQVLRDNFVERTKAVSSAGVIANKLASIESVLFQQAEAA